MSENTKLKLTCCTVGMLLWMMLAPILCLLCYEASPQGVEGPDLGKDWVKNWVQLFAQAQKKVAVIGAICGLILGFITSILFEHRPQRDHVIVSQANRGKMFGLAPKTKAEAIVPMQVAIIGAAISIGIAVFVLPRFGQTGILMVKPHSKTVFLAVLEGMIISTPILPLSLKIVAKLSGWKNGYRKLK
jgi:hypothetical protein